MEPLSRRGFLAAAAGTALAGLLPGCSGARSRIGGNLVGAGAARGHLLRDGPPQGAPAARDRAAVVIAGGGVAGLSAAWRFARDGFDDFVLLELEDDPGGTAASGANGVSAYPWGAHYVPVPTREQRALCELLREAGAIRGFDGAGRAISVEDHLCRAPQERTFDGREWREGLLDVPGGTSDESRALARFLADMREFSGRRGPDGRRWFAFPVASCSSDPDARARARPPLAEGWARAGHDAPGVRWYAEYACRDDYGCLLDQASAWAGIHYFAARLAGPDDGGADFLTWPEGNGYLVRRLARAAAGRVRTGAVVLSVDPGADAGPAIVRWLDTATGTLRETEAQRVVAALPRFAARRVVRGLDPAEPGFRTGAWAVANLTLRRRPSERGFPLAWDNVLAGSASLGYVVATHQSDRAGTSSVWTWYRPFCGADPAAERARLAALPWESFRDAALDDLLPAHPDLEECVERVDARVWGHAMVRPEPGFLWGGAREAAARPRGRVHFAAADLGGLPLFEEAQWAGVRAAEEALAALGRGGDSLL